ncbi:MAG: chemotaxis protein CheC [Desulfitobacteriia bacterium]|jgi:chemotaxis protein CheX
MKEVYKNIYLKNDFVTSAVSEIANIISGNALNILTNKELTCNISPPKLVQSESNGGITNCISTSIGDVYLEIRLNPTT